MHQSRILSSQLQQNRALIIGHDLNRFALTTSFAGSASGFIFRNHCVEMRGSTIDLQRSQMPTACVCCFTRSSRPSS